MRFLLAFTVSLWACILLGSGCLAAPQAVSSEPAAANASLLPVRPKDFNPMNMPPAAPPMPDAGSMEAQQQLMQANAMSGMYMAQLADYIDQLARFNKWLMLVAGTGLLLFCAQLAYMRKSLMDNARAAGLARAHAELEREHRALSHEIESKKLRAYVFTNGAKGELQTAEGGKYSVRVEIKNFGTTPAYNVSGWITVFIDDCAVERDIRSLPRESEVVETLLPPGGVCFYYARTHQSAQQDIKAISLGERAVYAYGEVQYKDIFGVGHYARFRIKCTGERNFAAGSFDHCIGGNEAN